jgi:TonB family protein
VTKSKSLSLSLLIHSGLVLALLALHSAGVFVSPVEQPVARAAATRLIAPAAFHGVALPSRGGSGNQTAPARKGVAPPRVYRAFLPPVRQPDPKLPMPVGVEVEAPVTTMDKNLIGDPLSKMATASLGQGPGTGIGDHGCCGGIGPGRGGGPMLGDGGQGHPVTAAQLIYKIEPEFSEEARRAKFQGTVILVIQVEIDGTPTRMRVVSSPGMGLDEKALEAVAKWRFRPAFRDGKPFVSSARVEVNFHFM